MPNALVVLIHGFTGGPWKTWDSFPELLQDRSDPTARSYDVHLFKYNSNWLYQPSLSYAIGDLRAFLKKVGSQYDTIVLIAHSQGGLIAKLYIIDELLAGNGDQIKVDLVITCATPHHGIFLCNLVYVLRKVPILGRLIRCDQLCELATWSPFILKLRQHWREPLISITPCAPSARRRHIRSVTVASNEWIVNRDSALGYYIDQPDLHGGSGHGMTTEKLDRLFTEYLEQHASPSVIINEIARICFDPAGMAKFIETEIPTVAKLLGPLVAPGEDIEAVSRLCIKLFLSEFPRRPLRSVQTVREALQKYVSRRFLEAL